MHAGQLGRHAGEPDANQPIATQPERLTGQWCFAKKSERIAGWLRSRSASGSTKRAGQLEQLTTCQPIAAKFRLEIPPVIHSLGERPAHDAQSASNEARDQAGP